LTEYIDERFGNLDLNYNDHSITFGIQIKTTILAKANGTFIWANPAFDMLQGRRAKGDIEDCLEDVPPGVDTMIEHISRLSPRRRVQGDGPDHGVAFTFS
jgi:hypothetical protein